MEGIAYFQSLSAKVNRKGLRVGHKTYCVRQIFRWSSEVV